MTCAKARPFPNQALGTEFYQQEHCKPLFKKYKILAMKNLYTYHTFMEVFKILKFRYPISLHEQFQISSRKETTLITSFPSADFISRSTSIWNTIAPKFKPLDYSNKINATKLSLKKALFNIQHAENEISWTESDFDIRKIAIQ